MRKPIGKSVSARFAQWYDVMNFSKKSAMLAAVGIYDFGRFFEALDGLPSGRVA